MICISVTPASRKFAKVDLLNAQGQGDLIELCLDRLIKPPDMKDLLDGLKKPVLVSCRNKEQGGQFEGTEDERMMLLREAIVAGPAYIELDLETAKKIPRFGDTKRVISYTSLDKALTNIDGVFDRAAKVHANIVKFTWPTPTLEDAWPLLAAVNKKKEPPVVGLGLGNAGLTFSLLGRKYGSPWIYAALEKGMEAFENQPTVGDLDDIYLWRKISPKTKFIGMVGFGAKDLKIIQLVNTIFDTLDYDARCLPFESRNLDTLKQMLNVLKVNVILANKRAADAILRLADELEESARRGQYADMLFKKADGWHGFNTIWRSSILALESVLGRKSKEDRPLDKRNILVLGSSGLAQTMVHGISKRKGMVSITDSDDEAARSIAQMFDVRLVPYQNLYNTLADVLIVADRKLKLGSHKAEFNPSYLNPPLVVMDVANAPDDSPLIKEARDRECKLVEPSVIYFNQLSSQIKSFTGMDINADQIKEIWDSLN